MKLLPIATLALLSGCAAPAPQVVTRTVYVPWTWPAALTDCAPDPPALPVPHIAATDSHAGSRVAAYIRDLRAHDARSVAVADDCRDTLAAAEAANKGAQ